MDELGEKLSDILNNPEAMNKVRMMAESLLGDDEEKPQDDTAGGLADGLFGGSNAAGLDGETLAKVMGIMSRLKTAGDDSRTALLLALKPHLKESRQKKVDTAVKLLRLIEILPYLKDSGLLDF